MENDVTERVTRGVTIPPEPDEVELVERAAIAIELGGVPVAYADAWARLQIQKPMAVSDNDWRLAINDASIFLDAWGSLADEFQWPAGELFDVPRDGRPGGLIWFIQGERIEAFGPQHARTDGGRTFDRLAMKGGE